jgi:hypothetical protein
VAHYQEKNEVKLKIHRDIYTWIANIKNRSFKFEVKAEPKDFNNDEKTLELKHESKYETDSEVYSTEQSIKFGSPRLGPLRLWLDVSLFAQLFSISIYFLLVSPRYLFMISKDACFKY